MTDPTPESAPEDKGNLPDAVQKTLEEIKAAMEKNNQPPATPASPTVDDRREAIKKSLNYSEEQMQAHEASIMKSQAPVIQALGWQHIEKKTDVEKYKKEIEEELKQYAPENQTPALMEKIYYYVRGKHADSKPAAPAPGAGGKVIETRVSRGPGYSGAGPSLTPGKGEGPEVEEPLNDLEKFVADRLGVSDKDYANSKKVGRTIRELKLPDTRQATSMADMELKRLQATR